MTRQEPFDDGTKGNHSFLDDDDDDDVMQGHGGR